MDNSNFAWRLGSLRYVYQPRLVYDWGNQGMTTYAISVTAANAPGDTGQAIVGTPEWATQHLGGEWVAMPDPYSVL